MFWRDPYLWLVLLSSGFVMSFIWWIPHRIPSILRERYRMQTAATSCLRLRDLELPTGIEYARGTIVGLTRGVNKYHIVRATLESLAYQVNDVLEVMKEDAGSDLAVLRVDGGASANNLLLQIQANISNVAVERPECIETTALGAAYLAGLAVGFWESKEAVLESRDVERIFRTEIDDEKRNAMVKGWRAAVGCSRDWIKKIQ